MEVAVALMPMLLSLAITSCARALVLKLPICIAHLPFAGAFLVAGSADFAEDAVEDFAEERLEDAEDALLEETDAIDVLEAADCTETLALLSDTDEG